MSLTEAEPEVTADAASAGIASRVRVVVTMFVTIMVVVLEWALLMTVYYEGQSVVRARVAVAQYSGIVETVAPGQSPDSLSAAAAAVQARISAEGMGGSALREFRQTAALAATAPMSQTRLSSLKASVESLNRLINKRQRTQDMMAKIEYGSLLFFASIGWMVWFRRLVSRHRALQREVTEQQARAVSDQRLAALSRNASDLVVVCNEDSTVIFATQSAFKVIGVDSELLLGRSIIELVDPDQQERFMATLTSTRRDEQALNMRLRHAGGHFINVEANLTNLRDDPSVGGLVLNLRDVTERLQLEDQLSRQAFHDELSGLANRQLFADRLSHALERRSGMDRPLVVLLCDLDNFKDINDSQGHRVGDAVITIVGERVANVIRTGDTAARLGGDEFAILMEASDLAGGQRAAERLLAAISEPIMVGSTPLSLHASVGIALAVPGEMTNEDALRNADVAMYQAKARGKSQVAVYESKLHAEALDKLELRDDLALALSTGKGLVLFYQPTVDMPTNEVVGYEALIRWQHPTRGFLPPGLFIPMAEEHGLIAPLGSWVLTEACYAAVQMLPAESGSTGRVPSIAINVASEQLAQAGFVDEVLAALASSGLPSSRLTLEITEGVILEDLDAIAPRLAALRELGIRVAIDDFGTGYSSLAYLSHLPVDILKVDKSFVDRVTLDQQDASVTEAIIAMGQTMKMKIVAEGVEDPEQASWLRGVKCDIGQGYVWSRPVPFDEARKLAGTTLAIAGMSEARVVVIEVEAATP